MKNMITSLPMMGDIMILDADKNVRFIKSDTYDSNTFPQGAETIGVVVFRKGKQVCVRDKKIKDEKWSQGYYWTAKGWNLDGKPHDCTITFYDSQQKPTNPTFTYTAKTAIEVVAQLKRWFNAYAAEGGKQYNAYILEGDTLQIVLEDYSNWYEYVLNISSIEVSYDTGVELPTDTDGYAINGKGGYYKGMNWYQFTTYMKTTTSDSFNPTDKLMAMPTNPISLKCYLSDIGEYVRNIYGEGEDGWLKFLATYMIQHPTMRGIFGEGYKDGHKNTYLLADKTFINTQGESIPSYPAAHYCSMVGYNNPSVGKGRWHLPTMDELYNLVRGINADQTDTINKSIRAIGGDVVTFRGFWSCCRASVFAAWYFNGWYGYANNTSFYSRVGVVPLLLYKLNGCEE